MTDNETFEQDEPETVGRRSAFRRFAGGAAAVGIGGAALAANPVDVAFAAGPHESVSVWDHGAVGDGVTDDSAAIMAAAQAAGPCGTVSFEKGTHPTARFNIGPTGVTMGTFQTWHGGTFMPGGGSSTQSEIVGANLNPGAVGITAGTGCTLRDLRISGPGGGSAGGTTGLKSQFPTLRVERCSFYRWPIAEFLQTVWYSEHTACEWRFNATAQVFRYCYRVDITGPMYNNNIDGTGVGGTAIDVDVARSVNVFGGSIEVFGTAQRPGVHMRGSTASAINFFGTYWESAAQASGGNSVAMLWAPNWSVNLIGNTAYLTDTAAWVHGSGAGGSLHASGNIFVSAAASTTTPVAYRIAGTTGATVEIDGTDNWAAVDKGTFTDATLPGANLHIAPPVGAAGAQFDHHGRTMTLPPQMAFRTGTTTSGSRPSAAALGAGAMLFDTTLAAPIWSDGVAWVDANGTAV